MTQSKKKFDVYFEIGKKRVFAGALEWPGWCRSGLDEASALQALVDYAPRYANALRLSGLDFQTPAGPSAFDAVERLEGNATTDFGAPGMVPASDEQPMSDDELQRFELILKACWLAFDAAVHAAAGKELRKGPRGGGRDIEKMIEHVLGGEAGYMSQVGWKLESVETGEFAEKLAQSRQAVLEAMRASASGNIPRQGPRGGIRWPARYFARRVAWHVLDHAWEIEDRLL